MTLPLSAEEPVEPNLPGPLKAIMRGLDGLASASMAACGVMMVALIAIFGWLVVGRYLLNNTPTWVEQAALLLVVWITFLGAAVGVWRSTHLSIDFIREALPNGPREILRILTDIALVVFGGFMAWYGMTLALVTARRMMPMLGISEGWRAVPLGLCGALIVVFSLARLAIRLASLDRKSA